MNALDLFKSTLTPDSEYTVTFPALTVGGAQVVPVGGLRARTESRTVVSVSATKVVFRKAAGSTTDLPYPSSGDFTLKDGGFVWSEKGRVIAIYTPKVALSQADIDAVNGPVAPLAETPVFMNKEVFANLLRRTGSVRHVDGRTVAIIMLDDNKYSVRQTKDGVRETVALGFATSEEAQNAAVEYMYPAEKIEPVQVNVVDAVIPTVVEATAPTMASFPPEAVAKAIFEAGVQDRSKSIDEVGASALRALISNVASNPQAETPLTEEATEAKAPVPPVIINDAEEPGDIPVTIGNIEDAVGETGPRVRSGKSFGDIVKSKFAADAPIPDAPADEILTKGEEAALSETMRYSRKGALKNPVTITRQVWIEDMLTRGFDRLDLMKRGRAPARLRVHNDATGAFYDIQSPLMIAYAQRRHDKLHGAKKTVAVAPAATPHEEPNEKRPAVTGPKPKQPVTSTEPGPTTTESVAPEADAPTPTVPVREIALPTPDAWEFEVHRTSTSMTTGDLQAWAERFAERIAVAKESPKFNVGIFYGALLDDRLGPVLWKALNKGDEPRPEGVALADYVREKVGVNAWTEYLNRRVLRSEREKLSTATKANAVQDWSYLPGEVITPRGRVTRIRANLEAIRTLKKIESENRMATEPERGVLAKYNGWGPDKEVFNRVNIMRMTREKETRGAEWFAPIKKQVEFKRAELEERKKQRHFIASEYIPDEDFVSWYDNYGRFAEEAQGLLTPEETAAAAQSTLNAHYTEEEVCHWLWKIVKRAGFEGGRVLEPAIGGGRVQGAMPADLRAVSKTEAVELDSISARISAQLFPNTKVHGCGFEEAPLANSAFDLVITNVPFGETGPGIQEGDVSFNLHNYFIAESLRKLRPGGLAVIITSSSTMENNIEQREALAKMGELWGAVRLPADAFAGNANTEVVTDVLVLRRPLEKRDTRAESWLGKLPFELATPYQPKRGSMSEGEPIKEIQLNEFYINHPEMVLGEHTLDGRMYGREDTGQYSVRSPKEALPIAERLEAALLLLPEAIPNSSQVADVDTESGEVKEGDVYPPTNARYGSVERVDGRFYQVAKDRGPMGLADWSKPKAAMPEGIKDVAEAREVVGTYVDLRDTLTALMRHEGESEAAPEGARLRARLNQVYDAVVVRYGSLFALGRKVKTLHPVEPMLASVTALETVRETPSETGKRPVRSFHKADILTKRTIFAAPPTARVDSFPEAISASLNVHGRVSVPYVADLMGKTDMEEVAKALCETGLCFIQHDDATKVEHIDSYLSGDVVTKLEDANRLAQADSRYQANVKALELVVPPPAVWDTIRVPFGAHFIPPHLYTRFLREVTGAYVGDNAVLYDPRVGQLQLSKGAQTALGNSTSAQTRFGTNEMTPKAIVQHALDQTAPKIMSETSDGTKVFNPDATEQARQKVLALADAWTQWCGKNEDAKAEILTAYNTTFNRVVNRAPSHSHMKFPGLSPDFVPRDHQRAAVARYIHDPSGICAYGVGFGKTAVGVITARERKRMGLSHKPLIVCDSANYGQFVGSMQTLYPGSRLLVADDANFSPDEREAFKAAMAYGDYDCILMSRTQFEKVPISPRMEADWLMREINDLIAQKEFTEESGKGAGAKTRQIEKAILKKQERVKALLAAKREKADGGLYWEDLGIDLLIVDESHRHKKIGFNTNHRDIKGIDSTASSRGRDLLIKGRYLQDRQNGRGVIGLTGTPCTNTMAEFWAALQLTAPHTLEAANLKHFDAFKGAFCVTVDALEMNEANGKFRMVKRLAKFVNGPAFITLIRSGMLVEMDSSKLKLDTPALKGGQIEMHVAPLNDQTLTVMERLGKLYETYEKKKSKDLSWVPLVLMQMGMAASIDPRLVEPNLPPTDDSLMSAVTKNVSDIYKTPALAGKAQVVFLDRYGDMDTSILNGLEAQSEGGKGPVIIIDDDAPAAPEGDEEDAAEEAPSKRERRVNLYELIREDLVRQGVKREHIACIDDVPKKGRAALFERVNRGEILVIIGSSDKLGIGANFQKNLYAAHHVDPARNMTPDQMEQRNGRIVRQGNTNKEVRVIYYGMEDTCCPAVLGRIQRKTEFIKQGYAERGIGPEFEDVSEVRLEEMKAALIPDKRAMQLSELKARLVDEKRSFVAKQMTHDRTHHMLNTAKGRQTRLLTLELPLAKKLTEWVAGTKPCAEDEDLVTVDASGVKPTTEDVKAWLTEHGTAISGPRKEVVKKLEKLAKAQQETRIPYGKMELPMGEIVINGVRVTLSKMEGHLTSGRDAEVTVAKVYNPAGSGVQTRDLVRETRYSTGDMMLKTASLARFEAQQMEKSRNLELDTVGKEIATLEHEVSILPSLDDKPVQETMLAIKTLEKNMIDVPYVRGERLRKNRTLSQSEKVPLIPDAPTLTVKIR